MWQPCCLMVLLIRERMVCPLSWAPARMISNTTAFHLTYHAAAGIAGVLQMVVQQFGGSVLEGFGQSTQQHGELWGVELKQSDQHHLGRLEAVWYNKLGVRTQQLGYSHKIR